MGPGFQSSEWEDGWLTFTSQRIHFNTESAGDVITAPRISVWICSRSVGTRPECVFGCVFWGGGSHALYISLGTSDTPRPPKQTLLCWAGRWGHIAIRITIIVPWRITKSFSLPYGEIPGFSGAGWKAPPFLPWLLRWGTPTARESLEVRNVSNVELRKRRTEACLTQIWRTCEKQNHSEIISLFLVDKYEPCHRLFRMHYHLIQKGQFIYRINQPFSRREH